MNTQHELLFIHPELRNGINVTVRNGDKWYNKAKIGDELNIYKTSEQNFHQRIAFAKIVGLAYIPSSLIPNDWLAIEHDSSCHDLYGLSKAMKKAYSDYKLENLVTIILFDVIKLGDRK